MAQPKNVTIPLKLDAFVFNPKVCDGGPKDAKIASITQPNYTFLQLDDSLIQNDILNHVDLHNAAPSTVNPRMTDLGQQSYRMNRIGVYLHWVLPRFYRSGVAATPSSTSHDTRRQRRGFKSAVAKSVEPDYSAPDFRPLPNRWLVIRRLDPDAPTTVPNRSGGADIPAVEAWVVESDRMRTIDDGSLDDKDLQVDISPYITSKKNPGTDGISIAEQAEIFIGYKDAAKEWEEDNSQDRANLTVLSSSNHLFPDYQPHCGNVFSTLDTFACNINGVPGNLSSASASYYVIGWHSDETQGPFGVMDPSAKLTREGRLKSLSMTLNGDAPWPPEIDAWLKSEETAQVLCHGAMYDVDWNAGKAPDNIPANDCSRILNDSMPVAVGTTPIDCLLSYIESHQNTDLEKDLALIGPLLRAQDDSVDAQRAATDEMQNWNFARTSGGLHWHFQNQPDQPAVDPTTDEANDLETLNQAQKMLDSTAREILQLRWDMFSYWWQYASATLADRASSQFPIGDLTKRLAGLIALVDEQNDAVLAYSQDKTKFPQLPKAGVQAEFRQPRDPTLLVAGIQAGWPDDYLDSLKVRLDTQLIPLAPPPPVDMSLFCIDRLPVDIQGTALALAQEFLALQPSVSPVTPGSGEYLPLYHDHGKHGATTDPLRDQWGKTQPWFPLFVEWEAEYFHVPWVDWALTGKITGLSDQRWRLGIAEGVNLEDPVINDTRTVSGRILLLPQPNFSLQADINNLFNSVDPRVLEKYLPTQQQRDEVRNNTYKLPFLSAPLDGFIDHLLTLVHGTHIKPIARYPLQGLQAIPDAAIGPFNTDTLNLIQKNSELTPYGSLVRFTDSRDSAFTGGDPESAPIPFKPVTHGQFRFTKLNIIDKFGQAIHAIDPRYDHEYDEAVYPCISDYFEPQLLNDQPNVVREPARPGFCEFVQIPPQINQPARLNSAFLIHDPRSDSDSSYSYWRPVTEWENPIWGWLVLNYVDYGIQVFLPDGTFYREVRIASPTAPKTTSISAKWLPFDPPKNPPDTGQLDYLLAKLADPDQTYLLAFLGMANKSLDSSTSVPSAYASFLNSLVGRPLALANAGWSLELAADAKKDQSSLDDHEHKPTPTGLLDGQEIYKFPVKLGDDNRTCDGLVGYFNTIQTKLTPGNELDLTKLYTYYADDPPAGPMQPIGTSNYPKFPSFWLTPDNYLQLPTAAARAKAFTRDWNQHYTVFGTIIDPFVPITAYSSILPIQNLQLPSWTWEKAFKKMTAFFHMGPIIVTEDVQKYWDPTKTLSQDTNYTLDPPQDDQTVKGSAVGIPSLPIANWAWLQPFVDPDSGNQEYMALGLGKVDSRPKYEKGPYTAIEGYLQLKAPIVRPDAPSPPAAATAAPATATG